MRIFFIALWDRKGVRCDAKRLQILKLNRFQWFCQLPASPEGDDNYGRKLCRHHDASGVGPSQLIDIT